MWRTRGCQVGMPIWGCALVVGVALSLAACSASSGLGTNSTLLTGLGAASDSAAGTPTLSGNDPGGQYAFVYGNQVWIKRTGDSAPHQLTHLAFSSGSYFAWGPLAWSPSGSAIAFALVQDVTPGHLERSTGGLYVVNTASGDVQATAGTASIYGHAYAWYGDHALFYANGSGITFYDLSDPSNPRPWRLVWVGDSPDTSAGPAQYFSYGDLAFFGQVLFATRFALTTFGVPGQIGHAQIYRYNIPTAGGDYAGGSLNYNGASLYGYPIADLGIAYADPHGDPTAGAWQIAANGGMVYQQVTRVDTKAGTVAAKVCYDVAAGDGCDRTLFQQAASEPLDAHPQFAFSGDSNAVALTGPSLATQQSDGSGFASENPGGWGTPPQWSRDGKTVIATQLVSAMPDTSGVIHYVTNLVSYVGGKSSVLIAGAQDFSWGP
jgi:hypothetical protein